MASRATYTTNYQLVKPDTDDSYDIDIFNGNTDKIDNEIKKNSDKIGNLPNLKTTKKDNLVNAINEVKDLATKGYTFNEFTLLSGSWSGQTYSLEGSYPSSKYDIEVELSGNATKEIAKAWGKIIPVPDTSGRNIIKALGTVPSINIPVRLKVVSK